MRWRGLPFRSLRLSKSAQEAVRGVSGLEVDPEYLAGDSSPTSRVCGRARSSRSYRLTLNWNTTGLTIQSSFFSTQTVEACSRQT